MKKTMSRSIAAFILALAFLAGLGYLCFRFFTENDLWASQTYNLYLSTGGGLTNAGTIYDRNGEVLAESDDGERFYHEDMSIRLGTLHTVGDDSYNISTAVQTRFRSQLVGHSLVFGYGLPDSLTALNKMTVTLDADACGKVYDAFGGKEGACFVYNYKTGEILCMVSTPAFDPQNVPETLPDGSYLNNCVSGTYTPGSVYKIVTAIAALEYIDDIENMTFTCEGEKDFGGNVVTCMDTHGELSLDDAFSYSCNIAFADMATLVGADKMQKVADRLGVTESFDINGVDSAKGHYDVSDADANQLAWSGVGQYTNMTNPAQMAILCGAIANGGDAALPVYMEGAEAAETHSLLDEDIAERMNEIMRYTVSGHYGETMFGGLTVGAKTGTAEVGDDIEPNAWMVGYSTDEDYPLAFAVVVEEGGFGFYSAGPIARIAMIESAEALGFEAE
ncbi:MAG: penicillin-binding protein [Ruminococcus sp.]|nr:penicillin-binding protein [Ruminococcus sp.]